MNDIIGLLTPPAFNRMVLRAVKLNWRLTSFDRKDALLALLWEPAIIFLIFIVFIEKTVSGGEAQSYVQYALPGLASTLAFLAAFVSSAQTTFDRHRRKKAYHQWAYSPLSLEDVAMGEVIWHSLKGSLMGLILMLWAWIAGYDVGSAALVLPLVWFGGGVTAAAFGMIVGLKSTRFAQVNMWYLCLIVPLAVLSDTVVEAERIHFLIDFLVEFFPITYINHIARALLAGHLTSKVFLGVAVLLVIGTILCRLAGRDLIRSIVPNR